MARTALHLSPHPDDEVAGMPATLMALRDAGWRIVNLACGLGRPAQHQRRRSEVEEACRRAGFELLPCEPPLPLSGGDDLAAAEETLVTLLGAVLPALDAAIVCAPSPHDGHHAHELVGRAARRALAAHPGPTPPLWLWGIWADLPFPTMLTPFDGARLGEVKHALAAHASEQARLPLDRLIEARAVLNAGVGEERVYGSGLSGDPGRRVRRAALRGRAAAGRMEARIAAALRCRGATGLALGAPDRLVARGRVGARPPAAGEVEVSARRCAARRARSGIRA